MSKSIKAALKLNNTLFTIKGHNSYERDENGKYKPQVFKTHASLDSKGEVSVAVYQNHSLSSGMNVGRFGSSKMSLFTYTVLGKKATGLIRYADVTIIQEGTKPELPEYLHNQERTKKTAEKISKALNS